MVDRLSKKQRSKNMQAVKASGSTIEKSMAKALRKRGCKYKKQYKIEGKPDFVLLEEKTAIFCDSEFWHGKNWKVKKYEHKSNRKFWWKKIEGNITRDKKVNKILRKNGWSVLRFWGKDILKKPDKCIKKIENALGRRKVEKKRKKAKLR